VNDVFLVSYSERADAVKMADAVAMELSEAGIVAKNVVLDRDAEPLLTRTDLIVSFGGDGTYLQASFLAHKYGARVLGVELGRLGFLPSVPPFNIAAEIKTALETTNCMDRLALNLTLPNGNEVFAFNEIVVERLRNGQIARVATKVDGEEYLTYSADGVLVSTPTGSSGYNFSAGGPVIDNNVSVLILTPIAPHFTIDRSVVLGPSSRIELTALDKPAAVIADGREVSVLQPGQSVSVQRDPFPVRVVAGQGFSLVNRLRRGLRDAHA
jgi:NAD+ kinase